MYGDSHVKDQTVASLSYLQHRDPYTGKTTSLYWDGPQVSNINQYDDLEWSTHIKSAPM